MRAFAFAVAVLAVATPAAAITIADTPTLPGTDRTEVNALEETFFGSIERDGVEVTLRAVFKTNGVESRLSPEMLQDLQSVDEKCGKLTSVERYDSTIFGSRVVRDHFVAVHGSCLVRWDLTYSKTNRRWTFERFNFHTLQGDDWVR